MASKLDDDRDERYRRYKEMFGLRGDERAPHFLEWQNLALTMLDKVMRPHYGAYDNPVFKL